MKTSANILDRKVTHFVLWRPGSKTTPPQLIVGELRPDNPPKLANQQELSMTPAAGVTGLWEISASDCQLVNGRVYHHWFEVEDSKTNCSPPTRIRCTDPLAFAVDWRVFPPDNTRQPAAVIMFSDGKLVRDVSQSSPGKRKFIPWSPEGSHLLPQCRRNPNFTKTPGRRSCI